MDISSVLTALARRWYVAILVLALTGWGAYGVWQDSRPVYSGTTTLAVLPTPSLVAIRGAAGAGESSLANPFGVNATSVLGSLLIDQINNGAIVLDEEALGSQVAVDTGPNESTSYFVVTAVSLTPSGVVAALDDVAEQGPALLATIQTSSGSPSDQLYTSQRTRPDVGISVSFPDRLRSTLGIVLGGALLTILLCVITDSTVLAVQQGRRRRRSDLPVVRPAVSGSDVEDDAAAR